MNKAELVHRVEAHIPDGVLKIYRYSKRYYLWKLQQIANKRAIKRVRGKNGPLNVVFIVNDSSEWKYDSLFRQMSNNKDFNPIILLCPLIIHYSAEQAEDIYQRAYQTFNKRGYKVMKASETVTSENVDITNLSPDIIFYSSLWTGYMHPKYNQYNLRKYLKCYIDYGYCSIADEWGFSSAFHGLMWRYFAECEDIKQLAITAQPRELKNTVVTGYPIYDEYESASGNTSDWKNADRKYKRVIWAPHHTIEGHNGLLKFSTFLENAQPMLNYALNQKEIQFVFKPHPLLLQALYDHPQWGKEKADAYYQQWAEGKNTALVTGAYMDLFKSSDAMIHDCGSFIVEYLYTQKPVLFLGKNREEQSNIVGIKAYRCHYHGSTIEDIKMFLEDVVLNGKDDMKPIREQFHKEVLLPPNNCFVAENIINEIKRVLR